MTYDQDSYQLRMFEGAISRSSMRGVAEQAAMKSHPVTRFVKTLPVEPALYPAIGYLAVDSEGTLSDSRPGRSAPSVLPAVLRKDLRDQGAPPSSCGCSSEMPCTCGCAPSAPCSCGHPAEGLFREDDADRPQSGSMEEEPEVSITDTDLAIMDVLVDTEDIVPSDASDGSPSAEGEATLDELDYWNHDALPFDYIHWSMPTHDHLRPKEKRCGFVRKPGAGLVHTACPEDPAHFIKGKRMHCWSLGCPECMNDTALKRGVELERRLLAWRALIEKQGGSAGDIGHWVVSPPQDAARSMLQLRSTYDELCRHIEACIQDVGGKAGVMVCHPWRQKSESWEFAPHFHILCYGRLDTRSFMKANPGWIIKKVHPKQRIRSIRHTLAYLFTHMGLGIVARDPDEIDWDLDIIDLLIPGVRSGEGGVYTERDWEDLSDGKGRMTGDLSGIDWTQWTMDRLSVELRVRTWGGCRKGAVRIAGICRQYRIRVCQECGSMLHVFEGFNDPRGKAVLYIRDCPVYVFADRWREFVELYKQCKSSMDAEGFDISDLARVTPWAVCSLEFDPRPDTEHPDILVDGPFARPDAYYIDRQRRAFSSASDDRTARPTAAS